MLFFKSMSLESVEETAKLRTLHDFYGRIRAVLRRMSRTLPEISRRTGREKRLKD